MYSLTDIYNLSAGTTTTLGTGTIETTPTTVAETGKTLTEVYTAIAGEIDNLSASVIASGTTAFGIEGEATLSTPAPTFATSDITEYNCSWFTTMTDPEQPAVTSEDICIQNSCSWDSGACTGGLITELQTFPWTVAYAACANSTAEGQTIGTWRLATYLELVNHYMDNNIAGGAPTGFVSDYSYWAGTTSPVSGGYAYGINMTNSGVAHSPKASPNPWENFKIHCAR